MSHRRLLFHWVQIVELRKDKAHGLAPESGIGERLAAQRDQIPRCRFSKYQSVRWSGPHRICPPSCILPECAWRSAGGLRRIWCIGHKAILEGRGVFGRHFEFLAFRTHGYVEGMNLFVEAGFFDQCVEGLGMWLKTEYRCRRKFLSHFKCRHTVVCTNVEGNVECVVPPLMPIALCR